MNMCLIAPWVISASVLLPQDSHNTSADTEKQIAVHDKEQYTTPLNFLILMYFLIILETISSHACLNLLHCKTCFKYSGVNWLFEILQRVKQRITKGCNITYLILYNKHEHGSTQAWNAGNFKNLSLNKTKHCFPIYSKRLQYSGLNKTLP